MSRLKIAFENETILFKGTNDAGKSKIIEIIIVRKKSKKYYL